MMPTKKRTVMLIAVLFITGTILQFFLSLFQTILTPDVITAFACLAIILFRPRILATLCIGITAGFLSMLIPGSMLPAGNLVSGPAGALCCYGINELVRDRSVLAPLVASFCATVASGFAFVLVATIVKYGAIIAKFGSFGGFFKEFLPIIILTAALNGLIVQILAFWPGRMLVQEPG